MLFIQLNLYNFDLFFPNLKTPLHKHCRISMIHIHKNSTVPTEITPEEIIKRHVALPIRYIFKIHTDLICLRLRVNLLGLSTG